MSQRLRFFLIGGLMTALGLAILWVFFAICRAIWHHPGFLVPILIIAIGGGITSYVLTNDDE